MFYDGNAVPWASRPKQSYKVDSATQQVEEEIVARSIAALVVGSSSSPGVQLRRRADTTTTWSVRKRVRQWLEQWYCDGGDEKFGASSYHAAERPASRQMYAKATTQAMSVQLLMFTDQKKTEQRKNRMQSRARAKTGCREIQELRNSGFQALRKPGFQEIRNSAILAFRDWIIRKSGIGKFRTKTSL